jgi:5-methyltetrahydrofolate--homocysteine methyltransferase
MSVLEQIYGAVLAGDRSAVEQGVAEALDRKTPAGNILAEGLISPMKEIGNQFEQGEIYVPEMLVSARAMKTGLTLLKPHLQVGGIKASGKVVIGTVQGDLHDIGKNLVGIMLEGAGYEVVDLGTDVNPAAFADAARENGAQIVAMSALLTTTMASMHATIEAIEDYGIRQDVRVIIGGAPVTQDFANEIGADGFAADASRAVGLVGSLLSK